MGLTWDLPRSASLRCNTTLILLLRFRVASGAVLRFYASASRQLLNLHCVSKQPDKGIPELLYWKF